MAKKDNDNFDFDTESEGKGKFDLVGFFKNLTKNQKGIIIGVAVAVGVIILAIIIASIIGGSKGNGFGGIFGAGGSSGSNEITHIYVSTPPNKTTYSIGEEIDYSGLSIVVNTLSFRSETVFYDEHPEDFTFSGYDNSAAITNQVITVTYKGFSTTFKIDIEPDPDDVLHLVKIELISMPKTEFKVGDLPSFSGGKILCTYSDGSTYTTNLTFGLTSGFEQVDGPGEYTITIEFWDGDYCETTTYTITVTE